MLNRYEKIRIVVAVDNGSVDYTYGKVIVGRIMYAHHIGFFPFSECEISSLIVKGGVMLMSPAEEKIGECVVWFAATDVVDFLWSQLVQLRIWSARNAVFALLCA